METDNGEYCANCGELVQYCECDCCRQSCDDKRVSFSRSIDRGAIAVDDNFGVWDGMDDPDMVDFYLQVQKESRPTECQGCGRIVNLRPGYGYCNSCADKIERGMDF